MHLEDVHVEDQEAVLKRSSGFLIFLDGKIAEAPPVEESKEEESVSPTRQW